MCTCVCVCICLCLTIYTNKESIIKIYSALLNLEDMGDENPHPAFMIIVYAKRDHVQGRLERERGEGEGR